MNYKISRFHLGTGKTETILKFQSPFKITEMCYINNLGVVLLFKDQHCLGLVDSNNKFIFPWAGTVNSNGDYDSTAPLFDLPSSACYCELTNLIYVVEKGGTRIRKISLNPFYCSSVFGKVAQKKVSGYLSNFKDFSNIATSCCVDKEGSIYWGIRELNRCFKYLFNISDFQNYIGNGKYGFSIASDFKSSQISSPSSISCLGDSIYISDAGNHCIRSGSKVVAGCPNKKGLEDGAGLSSILDCPNKMATLKSIICFIDGNKIRYYSASDKRVGTLYSSPNVISISSTQKELIILEGQNEA